MPAQEPEANDHQAQDDDDDEIGFVPPCFFAQWNHLFHTDGGRHLG